MIMVYCDDHVIIVMSLCPFSHARKDFKRQKCKSGLCSHKISSVERTAIKTTNNTRGLFICINIAYSHIFPFEQCFYNDCGMSIFVLLLYILKLIYVLLLSDCFIRYKLWKQSMHSIQTLHLVTGAIKA